MTKQFFLHWQDKQNKSRSFAWFLEFLGVYLIFLYIAFGVYLFFIPGGWKITATAFTAIFITRVVISEIIRIFIKRSRPYQQYSFTPYQSVFFTSSHKRPDSFPSDHASMLTAASLAILGWYPLLGLLGALLAVIVGGARVLLGYHHPSDVFGGVVTGFIAAIAAKYLYFMVFT